MSDSQPMPNVRGHDPMDRNLAGLRHLDLPNKPSALLSMAMKDLERVERDGRYVIDMQKWHMPRADGSLCSICMAGAVLTKHMDPKDICANPEGIFDLPTTMKLMAIDFMRCGSVRDACHMLGHDVVIIANRQVPQYDDNPEEFRLAMYAMLAELRSEDL